MKQIKHSDKVLVSANKSRNVHKLDQNEHKNF